MAVCLIQGAAICAENSKSIAAAPNVANTEAPANTNLVLRSKRDLLSPKSLDSLPPSTRELAEQLEIMPLLSELYDKHNPPTAERRALLREKIKETLLESFFDASSVRAEADREQDALIALRQTLLARRDRQVDVTNAANFISSGTLNTVGSVLGFSAKAPPFPGNLNQMLSGVVSTGMSSYTLKQGSGGKTRGPGHPTVLAELFGRPFNEATSYPESVWRFFHGHSTESPDKSRVAVLEERWISKQYLEPHGSRREQVKIDLVCGLSQVHRTMTLDDLDDTIRMIGDVSTLASLMHHHLRDLLRMIDSDISF